MCLRKCFSSFLFFCRKIFFSVSLQFLFYKTTTAEKQRAQKPLAFVFERKKERKRRIIIIHSRTTNEYYSLLKKKKKKKTTSEEKQTQKEI